MMELAVALFALVMVGIGWFFHARWQHQERDTLNRMLHIEHEAAVANMNASRAREVELARALGASEHAKAVHQRLEAMHADLGKIHEAIASVPGEVVRCATDAVGSIGG